MDKKECPCCPKHCSIDNLSCRKGNEYFNNHNTNKEPQTLNEQVIMDLRKCGHLLHHNRGLNTNEILSDFSQEELSQLHELLFRIHSKIQ